MSYLICVKSSIHQNGISILFCLLIWRPKIELLPNEFVRYHSLVYLQLLLGHSITLTQLNNT